MNTGIKIFGDLHEKNKEAYDEIYETEQKIKDEAEKEKDTGNLEDGWRSSTNCDGL